MPCQHCKSPNHTLSGCSADIAMYDDDIKNFMRTSSFALRHQYQFLNRFSRPILAIICNRLGYRCSLSKLKLIATLIAYHFRPLLTIDLMIIQVASEQLKSEVKEAYQNLQMWNIDDKPDLSDFRNAMFNLLETYHRNAFGLSYSQQLINDIISRDDFTTILPFVPNFQNTPSQPPAAVNSGKAHLKKLNFRLKTDSSLAKAKECFMCCEERPHAKLGCSHEYCIDCLFGTAKVRTKTFITCAVCRAEIAEVQVGTVEIRIAMLRRLSEV